MQKVIAVVGVVALVVIGSADAHAQSSTVTWMRVARHVDATDLSHAQWDGAFASASNALTQDTDGGGADSACNVTLVRAGDRWWFDGVDDFANIVDQDDYEATVTYNLADAYAVEVTSIGWCNGSVGVTTIGCGWPVGWLLPFSMEAAEIPANTGGVLLAHEFGHTVGLGHSANGTDIMFGDIGLSHVVVPSGDCSEFRFDGWDSSCPEGNGHIVPVICDWEGSSLMAGGASTAAKSHAQRSLERKPQAVRDEEDFSGVPITDLVARVYEHNPVEVEDFYGPKDLAILRGMLPSTKNSGHRRNILGLIGLISRGDKADVDVLVTEAESASGDAIGATFALGMLTARTGSSEALDFLLARFARVEGFDKKVTGAGLGLTGVQRALEVLEADRVERRPGRLRFASAAEENRRIASMGFRRAMRTPVEFKPRPSSEERPDGTAGKTEG